MKHLVVVLTEPTAGREAEYNDYYEQLHLDEVLATTDWRSAQRFKLTAEQGMACPLPYLAVYEVEADDASSVLTNLNASRSQRVQGEALNRNTAGVWVFSEIGPKHERE
jgi:hypothetical protein